jgi:hypothetical protein
MSGHRPFSELVAKMSPKAREKIKRGTAKLLAEMEMAELRDALKVRQVQLAGQLQTTQAAISRLEKDPQNTKISTLRRYVEGLGGEIEVHAVFPDRSVKITNLTIASAAPERGPHLVPKSKPRRSPRKRRAATA